MPLAWLNAVCTPVVRINGYPHARRWGVHLFELPGAEHDLAVSFPYMFYDACPARIMVPIYPSHHTVVSYEAPYFRFMSGTMRVLEVTARAPHQPPGF